MKVRILCWTLLIKYFNVTSRRQARPSHPLYLRSQFLWMKQLPILFFKLQLTHYQTFLSTKNGPFTEGYSFDGRWYFGRKQHLGLRNLGESWRSSCLFMSEGRQEKGRPQPHLQQRQKMLILRCQFQNKGLKLALDVFLSSPRVRKLLVVIESSQMQVAEKWLLSTGTVDQHLGTGRRAQNRVVALSRWKS